MAKADGVVTEDEIRAFRQVFQVPGSELAGVERVFNLARQDVAGFDSYARQLARLFKSRPAMLEDVLDALFHIAKADHVIHPDEISFLESVATIFGFSAADFACIKARHLRLADDPWQVLGLDRSAAPEAVKQRYRKLAREHHPDRHIAAGMPEEMIALATSRLQQINAAYDRITGQSAP